LTDDQGRQRRLLRRQALSIGASVAPFGVAFGVACQQAGLSVAEAMGFSLFVFGGSAQFAAVSVLGDGGSAAAAILAGLLLNLRSLAFGVLMASALRGPLWWRALVSQLMIDESTAIGSSRSDLALRRYGYLGGGISVFVLWNLATFIGAALLSSAGDLVERLGLDATIPAAFMALLWPRLADRQQRAIAVAGATIALALTPVTPPGVPILASVAAVAMARVVPPTAGDREGAAT
jgi:predicted branched-subunit amino acid permease